MYEKEKQQEYKVLCWTRERAPHPHPGHTSSQKVMKVSAYLQYLKL